MYITPPGWVFCLLKYKKHAKFDIDKNIKEPKSNLPEEALQVRNFQIMPFISFFAKTLNLKTKFGLPSDALVLTLYSSTLCSLF